MRDRDPKRKIPPSADVADGLAFQLSLIRAINEASPDGILVVDEHAVVVSHNRRFFEVWDIPDQGLQGSHPGSAEGGPHAPVLEAELARVADPEGFLRRVRELYADHHAEDHCEIELRDGRTIERRTTGIRGADGHYLGRVWFFRDVTPRKRAERALRELATQDPLTGVSNRRRFFEAARHEFERARRHKRPLSILMLDVDEFKGVNDCHGHAAGDMMLKALCTVLQASVRKIDFVGRLGGEEFGVLLPEAELPVAAQIAERCRRAVEASVARDGGKELKFTASFGVAALSDADGSAEDCLRRADAALYRAKQRGRNRVESGDAGAASAVRRPPG